MSGTKTIMADYLRKLNLANIDFEYNRLMSNWCRDRYSFRGSRRLRPYQEKAVHNLKKITQSKFHQYNVILPTGSGKTFVAAHFIIKEFIQKNKTVFILAPNWELLVQHASTFCQNFSEGKGRLRRIGGASTAVVQFAEFDSNESGVVVLSTPHTAKNYLSAIKFDMLVIDEAHWGNSDGAKMLPKIIRRAKSLNRPVLHLTATPNRKLEDNDSLVNLHFRDLSPEFLAQCEIIRLETGLIFNPEFVDSTNRKVKPSSIANISNNKKRTNKIIEQVFKILPDLKKRRSIYYAGTVNEANLAFDILRQNGLRAGIVHSAWDSHPEKVNALTIERFRRGDLDIIVNVAMLTMGFDVPEVCTVIIARPIESETLYMQIVGRASRKTAKKNKFTVIDVHDKITDQKIIDIFEHAHLFKDGKSSSASNSARYNSSKESHLSNKYHYTSDAPLMPIKLKNKKDFDGFMIREGQSFGIEIELTWDDFGENSKLDKAKIKSLGNSLLSKLSNVLGSHRVEDEAYLEKTFSKNMTKWNVEKDGSCGLEITSPALMGVLGISEMIQVLEILKIFRSENNLKFNFRTGTHIHLGWQANDSAHLRKLVYLWGLLEQGLYHLLAPSRLYSYLPELESYDIENPNDYAMPLCYALNSKSLAVDDDELLDKLDDYKNKSRGLDDSRYMGVNFQNINGELGTIEFRALHGTDDPVLLVAWISFLMTILEKSRGISIKDIPKYQFGRLPKVDKASLLSFKEHLTNELLLGLNTSSSLYKYFFGVRQVEASKNWAKRFRVF